MKHPIKLITCGPGPNAAEGIAAAKRVLRRNDLRAVALITVDANGVGTLYGGASEGFYHHLISGAEMLKKRVMDDGA